MLMVRHAAVNRNRTILCLVAVSTALIAPFALSQSPSTQPPIPAWQTAAGGKLSFEVASVRQNKTDDKPSMNVDPTTFDSSIRTGGLYSAKNIVLVQYLAFAYKLTNKQLQSVVSQAPWTMTTQFDIEARADGDPSKDQYRLMMQSLLAERFKLAIHFETRQVPVYALVLAKPGKLGPQLRIHQPDDPVCKKPPAARAPGGFPADADGFPQLCGAEVRMKPSAPGRMKLGGRDDPMAQFAAIATTGVGAVDRPVLDQTGLANVDFNLEWAQVAANLPPGAEFHPDESAPSFDQALKEQLGLKLVPQKGPVEFFVIDHIEMPSEN
jgi:uncharacterized protein (TIGR03435 family)